MSIFEQYTGNIPLLFPTPEFCAKLTDQNITLTELGWSDKKMNTLEWIKYADFYNAEWMPNIVYFDSFRELRTLIEDIDTKQVSENMKKFNIIRKQKIYDLWKGTLLNVINVSGDM